MGENGMVDTYCNCPVGKCLGITPANRCAFRGVMERTSFERIEELEREVRGLELSDETQTKTVWNLTARIAELEASPWISVSDRLPDDDVLVFTRYKEFDDSVESFGSDSCSEDDLFSEWEYGKPTHWMPIPEVKK